MRLTLLGTVGVCGLLGACSATPSMHDMSMATPMRSTATPAAHMMTIVPRGDYRTGIFDEGGAEITAYDKATQRVFVVNGGDKGIDILDISNPDNIRKVSTISLARWGKAANSVAVHNGLVAVAVENNDKQAPGTAVFFDADGNNLRAVQVGALPDMITFSPDGKHVLVANEGEPNDAYDNDPEGSVSIIDIPADLNDLSFDAARTADFRFLNKSSLPYGMRTSNPGTSSVAQDVEPEYIAVSDDSKMAYVTLQENNAVAVIDIASAHVRNVVGLGFKNFEASALDASDKDGKINIRPWPVRGMYMPDSIDAIDVGGKTYLVIANEGDSRDYKGYSEEARVADVKLDPTAFPDAANLQKKENLGRLKITTAQGDIDGDGDFDILYAYGARSFSVLNASGKMIFDSGDQFEQILSRVAPENFNSNNTKNNSFDNRSDDKGPEPEGIAVGTVNGTPYAFIGLERMGGFMVYDMTNPSNPQFVTYHTDRDFSGDPKKDTAGDLAPEGMLFIKAEDSPSGYPMLVLGNEVSGSTRVYDLK